MDMMLQLLVVDEMDDRRAGTADALCELPGVEVCASASDTARVLTILSYTQADVVIAASDMTGSSIVALIDGVRRGGLAEVIVLVTDPVLLPGMREYWRDLGALAVVDTLPEVVAQVQALVHRQASNREIPRRVEDAMLAARVPLPAITSSSGGTAIHVDRRPSRSAPLVAIGDVLRDVLPHLRRLVHDEIEIVLEVGADVPRVRSTVADIERIALHLLHDAATAIPMGGKIWFVVEREGHRHVRIEVLDSSGQSRSPGLSLDTARVIIDRYCGALRVVDLGNATSLQAVLPAFVAPAN